MQPSLLLLLLWIVMVQFPVRMPLSQEPEIRVPTSQNEMLFVGEDLTYKVSYSFFNLGTIRLKITDRFEREGRTVYRAVCYIDSNPSIPFVNVHIVFRSEFDQEIFSYSWEGADSTKEKIEMRTITFDNENLRATVEIGSRVPDGRYALAGIDTVPISAKCQDGFSLFYYARQHARSQKREEVPTFIEKEQVSTSINFMNKIVPAEMDAVDYPVETVYFDGEAKFVGVFGMTGGFQGWFTNDEARMPIVARLKVILGSIRVELQRWERGGWNPPRYVARKKP